MRRALVALPLVLAACAGGSPFGSSEPTGAAAPSPSGTTSPTAAPPSASPSASPSAGAAACPASYAQPDPRRPVVEATLAVGADGVVTGRQVVRFTPDRPVDQLVFRLWGAAPRARAAGGRVDVLGTSVNGRTVTPRRTAPTTLRIPAGRVEAGRTVQAVIRFRLRLPTGANERLGHRAGRASWLGSGMPLLAWERGRGWALEPETRQFAEAATSEAFELRRLAVTRPRGHGVVATGAQVSDDGRTAVFRARSVRDVAVVTGRFRVARARAAGKEVVVATASGLRDSPSAVAREMARSVGSHASRLGPFPYERLAVAVVPDLRGGIEFPGLVLLGTGQADGDATGSHEVAHEWLYGLVGNNQGRDPWLDESFATYAEGLDRGTLATYSRTRIPADGVNRVGRPMTYWDARPSYYRSVYVQGAAMLAAARRAAGAAAFDAALRCYVRRNAHRIATPADVLASFRHLPKAVEVMRRYGALPR